MRRRPEAEADRAIGLQLGTERHAVHPLHSVTAAPPVSSAEDHRRSCGSQAVAAGTLRQRPTAAAKPGIAAMFSWSIARWWHARPPVVRVQRKQSTTGTSFRLVENVGFVSSGRSDIPAYVGMKWM